MKIKGNSSATDDYGNSGSCFNTSLKSVFVVFEKAKAPMAIVQDLASANYLVALRPGTQSIEHCKVVEILVPRTASTAAIQAKLKGSFSDVAMVTAECNAYSVAVPSLCFKQVPEALRNCSFNVSGLNRISDGQAYFTVTTSVSITPTHIASAFDEAQIEASCIELTSPHPSTQEASEGTSANQTNAGDDALNVASPTPHFAMA